MEKKVVFKKPKWLRRFASALLDFIAFVILSLLISLAVEPLSFAMLNGNEAKKTYYDYAVSTHLYEYDDQGNITKLYNLNTYDDNLYYFYDNCLHKNDEYDNIKKEKPEMFHYDETKNRYVENAFDMGDINEKSKYIVFYNEQREYLINNYLDDYLNQFDEYRKAKKIFSLANYLTTLLSALFGLSIVFILIPLTNKNYKTIGKMAFKLKVISISNIETRPTKIQILFRQLITVFFEYILSISTIGIFGIPIPIVFIASIILVLLTKYNQSFHDLCSQTIIIDDYPDLGPIDQKDKYEITYKNVKE